ncbi:MAG TPA: hypothetical protein VJ755_12495 [Gemmatimonadales bacterium]|nr:hypothetical protein [Gemmatimonadales bacterium]
MIRVLEGWKVGLCLGIGVFLSNIPTVQLSAQVGHDPASSPYRDVRLRAGPSFYVGEFNGSRGAADAAFSNARTASVRYEIPTGKTLLLQFNGAYLQGDRFIINPGADSSSPNRKTGPEQATVVLTDLMLHLRLTGPKSWRGFAPYAGAGIGFGWESEAPRDTTGSGYQFGTKFTVTGATGMRWHLFRHLWFSGDARFVFWKESYPRSFQSTAPDGSRVLSLLHDRGEWIIHPWFSVGAGWSF